MKTKVCVKAIIRHNGNLLIIQRSNNEDIGPGDWEFPGGTIEWDENAEDALHRELREEIGVQVISYKLAYISSFFIDVNTKVFAINYIVVVKGNIRLSDEHQKYKWVRNDEAQMLLVPSIYHDYHQYMLKEMY